MDLKETDRYLRQPRINYEENLYKRMDDFRRQEILCDTILQVDGQEFPAHKNVLAACSEYFLGLFTSDMKEKHQLEVKLEGFRAFVMNDLLHYIYTGEVEITDENVKELVFVTSGAMEGKNDGLLWVAQMYFRFVEVLRHGRC